jgi:hypothetical protein
VELFLGKFIVKGTTQVNGKSLKLYFCIFESSQGKHNSLNFYKSFGMFFISFVKYTCSKLDIIKNVFAYSKHSNFKNEQSFFFSNILLFYQMCTIHFENKEDFNLDD